MQTLRVIVYLNVNAKTDNKLVFERMIPVNLQDLKIDFHTLYSSLRILFGNNCIVVFELL